MKALLSPRNCGLFSVSIWHQLAASGSTKHVLSMALKLVLSLHDATVRVNTMSGFLIMFMVLNSYNSLFSLRKVWIQLILFEHGIKGDEGQGEC